MICNSAIYAVQLLSKFSERLRDVCYYHLKVNITGWLAGLIDPPFRCVVTHCSFALDVLTVPADHQTRN